ncbi:hypothetical protein [Flavobacterium sp. N502540]|uniref:hypothetical protein n=1 Tax=Flavobacterium sp. N502540 TaxID=2986838 RepID=UPI002224F46E|nr:hypothetical protein [Flavobacterium sp. N502540]
MVKVYGVDESDYKADFIISENYIKFTGELLRLSLLAIGGFGTLLVAKMKREGFGAELDYSGFIIALVCFVFCSGACMCHRFFATDSMSWFISLLRTQKNDDIVKIDKERKGMYRALKLSNIFLVLSGISFGLGVIFFFIAIYNLL